jgi:Skp family chaperone for outer membrane proteins
MTTESSPPPGPSFGRRLLLALGKLAKFTLRLLFVVVIGALLGLGIYWAASYGVATVNQQVFQPIQNHTRQLADLDSRYAQEYGRLNERTQALQEETQALQDQIGELERQGDATRETLEALESRLTTSEALLAEMQTTLETAQESLDALENEQTTLKTALEPDVAQLKTALAELETAVDALTEDVAQAVDDVEALSVTVRDEAPLVSVRIEVQLLKAMELLTRARVQLAQDNTGIAKTEVQEARNLLVNLGTTLPEDQQKALAAIVQRLELGMANLPNAPRLAADDLEVAWQLLVKGLPGQSTTLLSPLTTPPLTTTETLTTTLPVTVTVTPTPKP